MYKVNRSWDRLRTCIVGKSYPPEFYSYITNQDVRETMEQIATETEEDYQTLVSLLESFGVEVFRPSVPSNSSETLTISGTLSEPPMFPGVLGTMVRDTFYFTDMSLKHHWDKIRGGDWPIDPPTNKQEFDQLDKTIKDELREFNLDQGVSFNEHWWDDILSKIENPKVFNTEIANVNTLVFDDELYFLSDCDHYYDKFILGKDYYKNKFSGLPHSFNLTETSPNRKELFSFITPELSFMIYDGVSAKRPYTNSFAKCGITYLTIGDVGRADIEARSHSEELWTLHPNSIDESVVSIQNSWFHPVFSIGVFVIDEKNVICNTHNEKVFQIFRNFGITPHVVQRRHADFWGRDFNSLICPLHREN
jgi:hypothetical protein